MRRLLLFVSFPLLTLGVAACGWGSGSSWMKEPLVAEEERAGGGATSGPSTRPSARTIGRPSSKQAASSFESNEPAGGRVLGTFRNTYYDFPVESDFAGAGAALKNAKCETIATVPRGFHDAVCVQGSGSLAQGGTISFAKRDCACAEICPRTNQRICFDTLDKARFPWGRGASGAPITPLRSVAADTQVLPMGTVLYIPELEGVRTDESASDGCFVVEDRGLKVQGEHVDIFSGHPAQTAKLNAQVPSNQGVTIIVDSPKCAHLAKR